MKIPFLALCLIFWISSNANAVVSFWYQDGNWTVWSEKDKCKAINRPIIETSHAPYMSFWLVHDLSNPGVSIDAYFWPGAFVVGTKFNVNLVPPGGEQITVPAEAGLDFALRTERPLTEDEVALLEEQNLLIVKPSHTSFSQAVDAIKLPMVLRQLKTCADFLGQAKQK
ncbi:MAG: hypothetical protein K5905_09125 [Roseibium sp.]|uniref:hypothetical protein n=1 Tax=Roseibium sp. TaxID=1936156 RepID=UPI0026329D99|nr:hypothetical protein [Roseibium sp.]MCV0425624.1 hypothetical protein [Roseibium sp.]